MEHKINCKWIENMAFESEINNHKIIMDADQEFGGQDRGPRPKPLLLSALAGCSGMDVVSILKSMRISLKSFNMEVSGTLGKEHPKFYEKIHIKYMFEGEQLDTAKLEKAVKLSQEKYCGVSANLGKASLISHEIVVK